MSKKQRNNRPATTTEGLLAIDQSTLAKFTPAATDTIAPATDPLTPAQLKGINVIGDIMIPGGNGYPSFSESKAAAGTARMLPYMYAADRDPFLMLLTACAYLPKPIVKFLVATFASHKAAPGPIASVLRMGNLGLKGVIHSLYYSDLGYGETSIHQLMHYNPGMNTEAYEAYLKTQNAAE